MNPEDQPNAAVVRPKTPYVGMRAFAKNEEAIFFGRKRDASLLRDKVFSARLTVVYGPSGVGKSSILHTLLIPYLEEEAARVIYFDNWTGDDPLLTLKAELVAEAEKLKIPEPGAGAPDLTDLVLLLKSADNRTVVLILDQFEEFFTHGNNPEALRNELGALIRASDLDVRVLLSLREEHLAALEPFRAEILILFQSTYRLEPLNDEGVREAIEGPAKLFGVDFQPGLVQELIKDLRHKDNVTRWDPLTGVAVDLPMLQLICSELWKEMTKRGQTTITRTLYRNVGGQSGILKTYLRQVMPKSWREKILTAQLMRYLAPSDGHKVPYSAETLVELEELDPDLVGKELERLSDSEVRVLRDRSYEGKVFYELYHDRFISFIGPWRDKILQNYKLLTKVAFPASIVLLTVVFSFLAYSGMKIWEYKQNTDWAMAKLNDSMSAGEREKIFETVGTNLIDKKKKEDKFDKVIYLGSEDSFDKLKRLFVQYESFLPENYGIKHEELDPWRKKPQDGLSTLKYPPKRKLNEKLFWETWNNLSVDLTKNSGVMAPIILNLKKIIIEDHKPVRLGSGRKGGARTVRLEGQDKDIKDLDIEIPFFEDKAVIQPKGLSETGVKFLEKFRSDWTPMGKDTETPMGKDKEWLVVPRWSIPVWKSLDVDLIGGSAITAFLLAESLKQHPDRLLTKEAVNTLLDLASEHSRHTVTEARAVRQENLVTDLQEILKQGSALTSLPLILDALANYPEGSSSEVAPKVIADLQSPQETIPAWRPGAHPPKPVATASGDPDKGKERRIKWYYRKTVEELPNLKPKIAIHLGEDLRSDHRKVTEQIEKIKDTLMRRFGIEVPKVTVTYDKGTGSAEVLKTAFRVDFLSQVKETPRKDFSQEGALDFLSAELTAHRTRFITADTVKKTLDKDEMKPGLKFWLEEHYSLTDLKLLLRTVVHPDKEELVSRAGKPGATTEISTYQTPLENSMRQPAWLLASLVFWSQAGDGKSLSALAEDLRRTQAARLVHELTAPVNPVVVQSIKTGIKALSEDRVSAAEAAFAQAIKTDKEAAVSSFLVSYPEIFRQLFLRKYIDPNLWKLQPSLADKIELADILDEKDLADCGGSPTGRILRLVLLASYPEDYDQEERHKLVTCILEGYGEPDKWPAKEATWFGAQLLGMSGPQKDGVSLREKGLVFLQNGLGRLPEREAKEQFSQTVDLVLKVCEKSPTKQWCWELLPSLWKNRQDPEKAIDIAKVLVNQKSEAEVENTLTWIGHAQQSSMGSFSPDKKALLEPEADYLRARALIRLRELGAGNRFKELEQTLSRLKETPDKERQQWAYQELAQLWYEKDSLKEAMVILKEAVNKWPDDANFYSKMLEVNLADGDKEGAARTAREALEIFNKDGGKVTQKTLNFLDIAAWGQLATETGDWEGLARKYIEAGGGDVLDMAILLAWRLAGRDKAKAGKVLHSLKDRQEWLVPLQGNERLWDEMLLKYALGQMNAEELLGDLKDENFSKSKLSRGPMSQEGMLCEAYFYMALLAGTKGERAQMIAGLEKTKDTKCHPYIEYAIARYLLARQQELQ